MPRRKRVGSEASLRDTGITTKEHADPERAPNSSHQTVERARGTVDVRGIGREEDALVADLRRPIQETRSTLVGAYPDLRKNV